MSEPTTLLFALPGFRVLTVELDPDGGRRVLVESVEQEGGCPSCGVMSSLIKDRVVRRVKDLPHGLVPLRVWARKRRFRCAQAACERRSFTESTAQLPARSRLTTRLRERVGAAVVTTNRAVSEVAADYDLAWGTVHRILVSAAVTALVVPALTSVIGIDETRTRRVRWLREEAGWKRSDPWMTSIVDLDPASSAGIIGLTPGRTGMSVQTWLELQTRQFRDAIEVVAIDPSAPYAAGIRRALPAATIVVDHFHLVMLGNAMVTQVRQRVTHEQLGRRGQTVDPSWAHRQMLLRAGDTLSPRALGRVKRGLDSDDRTGQIGAAWAVKELLRQLLSGPNAHGPGVYSRHLTAHRRTRFLTACAEAHLPEATRLAGTVEKWWPEIEAFLQLGVTNARTEGYNRVIKQIKRVACGFRNQTNYERRSMLHSAATNAA